ncbi:hypothetical protein OIU85_021409 [Salix viminalis]|uniref:Uncharacterized protein n=1 Tax=Salix viminalis TaxID=40686 RepID=A0A9Q0UI89_SALVM|nr:hypothetical protein OIU85_021409 [Salix viminalis]
MNVMNYERTSLINNSHELECNLEFASASPDSNTRNDFTSDQFIESLLQIEADCRVETGIKNRRGSYSSTIPVNQERAQAVEVSNWHLASNIAGISEVLLSKADENLFSDTR